MVLEKSILKIKKRLVYGMKLGKSLGAHVTEVCVWGREWMETMVWGEQGQNHDKQTRFYSTWGIKTFLVFILRVK